MNLKEKSKKLKTDIPAIFIALQKEETPLIVKIAAGLTVIYALSPIDLIPDFIPVLGYLDDLIILPFLAVITIKLIPEDIFEKCRLESESLWKNGKPKKWYYAVPIILIWSVIILIFIKSIIR
ncbi:MAG: YkvA family protein [Sedimentibacter sp.]